MSNQMVKRAKGWPLSQDELRAAKKALTPKISFVSVMQKYSNNVEEAGASTFTHKSICPNLEHKNGHERTPSFYFSDEDVSFRCFGCGINGDVFDLISMMEGIPWNDVVKSFVEKEGIDVKAIDLDFSGSSGETFYKFLFETNLKISALLRDYLAKIYGTETYQAEKGWVDLMFKRMDDRFGKIPDGDKQAIKEFEIQILLELERKKLRKPRR